MTKRKSSFGATERMLLLLRYLSEKPHSMAQLRDKIEVDLGYLPDRVTIQNDLTRLKDWGFSLEVINKKRVLTACAFPVSLSENTLDALRIAFKLLDDIGLTSSAVALAEIIRILPNSQKKLLNQSSGFNFVPNILIDLANHSYNIDKLEFGIRCCQEVEFYYLGRNSQESLLYHLEPMSLDWKEGRLYLLAYQVGKNLEKSFRIDRIRDKVKVLARKFNPQSPKTYPISFRVWGNIAKQYQPRFYHEDQPISDPCKRHPDALLINAQITNYFWAKQRLLRYLPYVEIISPDFLVEEFKQITEEMVKLYLE